MLTLSFIVLKMGHGHFVTIGYGAVAHAEDPHVDCAGPNCLKALVDRAAGFRPEVFHPTNDCLKLRECIPDGTTIPTIGLAAGTNSADSAMSGTGGSSARAHTTGGAQTIGNTTGKVAGAANNTGKTVGSGGSETFETNHSHGVAEGDHRYGRTHVEGDPRAFLARRPAGGRDRRRAFDRADRLTTLREEE